MACIQQAVSSFELTMIRLHSMLLAPHTFACRELSNLFCKVRNQFLAVAKELKIKKKVLKNYLENNGDQALF